MYGFPINIILLSAYYEQKYIITFYKTFFKNYWCRDQSRYAPSQWEMSLQCNDISHWLGEYLDWSLLFTLLGCRYTAAIMSVCAHQLVPDTHQNWGFSRITHRSMVIIICGPYHFSLCLSTRGQYASKLGALWGSYCSDLLPTFLCVS